MKLLNKTGFKSTLCVLTLALGTLTILGCQVVRGNRSISQYSSDSRITSAVKYRLVNHNDISAADVHVETDKGVVLLSGFVKSKKQERIAIHIAKSVNGVKDVRSNLVLTK